MSNLIDKLTQKAKDQAQAAVLRARTRPFDWERFGAEIQDVRIRSCLKVVFSIIAATPVEIRLCGPDYLSDPDGRWCKIGERQYILAIDAEHGPSWSQVLDTVIHLAVDRIGDLDAFGRFEGPLLDSTSRITDAQKYIAWRATGIIAAMTGLDQLANPPIDHDSMARPYLDHLAATMNLSEAMKDKAFPDLVRTLEGFVAQSVEFLTKGQAESLGSLVIALRTAELSPAAWRAVDEESRRFATS